MHTALLILSIICAGLAVACVWLGTRLYSRRPSLGSLIGILGTLVFTAIGLGFLCSWIDKLP